MDNVGTVCKLTFVPSCILPAACQVERRKYLMSLMESLLKRLQAITDGEGDHIKYQPEEQYIRWTLFRAKIV